MRGRIARRWMVCLLIFGGMSSAPEHISRAPLKVCLVSGSAEYHSDVSLAAFKQHLESRYPVRAELIKAEGFDRLPGLEALERCDVALFFTRRLTITGEPLERVKKYFAAGKPAVSVRTSSHGFQNWLEFDAQVLGGHYAGHCGATYSKPHPTMKAETVPGAEAHPILDGIAKISSRSTLYKTAPLANDAEVLMMGSEPACSEKYPVTWTRIHKGGRVVYTSLGDMGDFENGAFRRLLANALFWAARRPMERLDLPPVPPPPTAKGTLNLKLRARRESSTGRGDWQEYTFTKKTAVAETAIIVCDMWDKHWCEGAATRCAALAEKMNPVLKAARARGIQIIHCPSETMDFYLDTPPRRRMQLAPKVDRPEPLAHIDPPLPIDDSDGGCDTPEKPWYRAWTRQHPAIQIGPFDGITDSGAEVYNFIRRRNIRYLIIMGVHTNMCVLNRSFAIKPMTRLGIQCYLARDLTDAMYNPQKPPHVSHGEGVELVVQHIEKYWCPTLTSAGLIAGLPK